MLKCTACPLRRRRPKPPTRVPATRVFEPPHRSATAAKPDPESPPVTPTPPPLISRQLHTFHPNPSGGPTRPPDFSVIPLPIQNPKSPIPNPQSPIKDHGIYPTISGASYSWETAPPNPPDIRTRHEKTPCQSKGSSQGSRKGSSGYHVPRAYE